MRYKPTDHKLYFTAGTASTMLKGEKVPVNYIYYNDPSCGYYIDPRGFLVLPNFNSISGDSEPIGLYIVDGVATVKPIDDVITIVNNFCKNKLISATSAMITGCTPDTDLDDGENSTLQLTGVVLPNTASQEGTWTTSDDLIATVSSTGLVTAAGTGTAIITFTSTDGSFKGTCSVKVQFN